MKKTLIMLAAISLSAGMVLAQTTTPTTTTVMTTTTNVATAICPSDMAAFPMPCAAKEVTDISGNAQILVLGSEERYALSNLDARHVNWRDTAGGQTDLFDPSNPLLSYQPNGIIVRHGNPNFPYYQVPEAVRVAGAQERFVRYPSTVPAAATDTLTSVANRYRNLSTQQAMALGYQPLGACIPNVGQMYVNQALIDNRFDAMTPEAFAFDQNGHLLAVHYIILSDQPFMAFGQSFQASPLVQGAQQLPVWLYSNNRNGMFAMQSNNRFCN